MSWLHVETESFSTVASMVETWTRSAHDTAVSECLCWRLERGQVVCRPSMPEWRVDRHRPWEPSSRNKSPPLGGATVTSVCGTSAWLTAWTRRCRPNYGVLLPSDADMLINGPILVETDRGAKSVLWELLSLEMEEFDALGTAMVLSIFSVLGFLQ